MDFAHEKRVASRLLEALEDGTLSTVDTRPLAEDADPALLFLIIRWLRARYMGHPAADGVLGRIVALCQLPSISRAVKAGERDAITGWFTETYDPGELDREAFIDIVVDKLEG